MRISCLRNAAWGKLHHLRTCLGIFCSSQFPEAGFPFTRTKTEGCLEMLWFHFSRFGFHLKKTDLIFLKAHKTSWAETWQLKFQPEECLELMVYAKDADRCCPALGRQSGEGVPGDRPCGCFVIVKFLLLNNFTLSETLTSSVLKF